MSIYNEGQQRILGIAKHRLNNEFQNNARNRENGYFYALGIIEALWASGADPEAIGKELGIEILNPMSFFEVNFSEDDLDDTNSLNL